MYISGNMYGFPFEVFPRNSQMSTGFMNSRKVAEIKTSKIISVMFSILEEKSCMTKNVM